MNRHSEALTIDAKKIPRNQRGTLKKSNSTKDFVLSQEGRATNRSAYLYPVLPNHPQASIS
jgi:hypothetical protein